MRVAIFGGAGFVGRRFCRRLAELGYDVTVVDNLCAGLDPSEWMFKPNKSFTFIEEDVRKFFRYEKADEFDLVIHCAAIVGGRLKIDGDPLAVATDLSIDSEMFNWVVRAKRLPQVIYFSSSAIYPVELQTRNNHCALAEPLVNFEGTKVSMPDQTYGWVKLCGEYLARYAHKQYGLDVKIYRPFGGYGEDQSFDYPFPSIIKRVLDEEDPIVVWGSGDQIRDFIYIEDIVSAVMHTLDKLPSCDPLNLGTGIGTSFMELADMARGLLKSPGMIRNDSTKPEGVFARVADPFKLHHDMGFPAWTPLKVGIQLVAGRMRLTQGWEAVV